MAFLTAAASSKLNVAVDGSMMVVGEIGLSGDIRGVAQIDRRLAEAAKLGMKRAMIPKTNASGLAVPSGMEIIPVANVGQALQIIR